MQNIVIDVCEKFHNDRFRQLYRVGGVYWALFASILSWKGPHATKSLWDWSHSDVPHGSGACDNMSWLQHLK